MKACLQQVHSGIPVYGCSRSRDSLLESEMLYEESMGATQCLIGPHCIIVSVWLQQQVAWLVPLCLSGWAEQQCTRARYTPAVAFPAGAAV